MKPDLARHCLIRKTSVGPRTFDVRGPVATRRPPGWVPYVVDNLWEWARPEGFPNRRHAAFASPHEELIEVEGEAFLVKIEGWSRLAQIPQRDARFHPDCRGLPRTLRRLLGQAWFDLPARQKAPISLLWAPCLGAEEVESLFALEPLASLREEIASAITLWRDASIVDLNDALPHKEGEIFFEAERWWLVPKSS